ncbi:MAG: hypothetical protein JRF63_05385 [Deltaproteobacteria bacterium]|nr:hypothetical protein [Deltaproteobacteria bacterium]
MLDADRENTTVSDPYTWEENQLGGVVIERVHFTWQPRDAFAVTGGRFITPFGIWNEDHGSPVLLPSYPPYMMLRQTIPTRQTGFMVHGRAVPWETLFFDYALTLSNGRGPTEQVYDLDDNKAIGLRLRATYERTNVRFAIGGYGFYGTTTDTTKHATNVFPPEFQIEQTERFKEIAGAADLLIEIFDVRLQAEYARGLIRYRTRPIRVYPMANVQSPYGELQPDYVRWDAYVLLAWTLPLDALLGDMKLTPFVMWDQSVPDDTLHDFDIRGLRGGLNFKPNSFVVIKADFIHVDFYRSRLVKEDSWIVSGQIAVAF